MRTFKLLRLATALAAIALALVGIQACRREQVQDEFGVMTVRERIAINAGADSYVHSGADVRWYSDAARATEVARIDGAGGMQLMVPTAQTTATPGLLIDNRAAGAVAIEVRDAQTPVYRVLNNGSVSQTGDQAITGDLSITGELAVAQATAATTATPAVRINSSAAGSVLFQVEDSLTPVFQVLNGGAVSRTGNDSMTGDLDVDGTSNLDEVDVDGVMNLVVGTEHIGIPSIVSTAITYTAAAGGSGVIATVGDGEIWFVHAVLVRVTEDFACTGDDCTLIIGDGNDEDGFVVLGDTELQTADTEGTGWAAGWQGQVPATQGVYIDEAAGGRYFVYAPSGTAETIDYLIDEADGETMSSGAATVYVIYTRIQ